MKTGSVWIDLLGGACVGAVAIVTIVVLFHFFVGWLDRNNKPKG